jgi:hypothetical protein
MLKYPYRVRQATNTTGADAQMPACDRAATTLGFRHVIHGKPVVCRTQILANQQRAVRDVGLMYCAQIATLAPQAGDRARA